MKKIFILLPLIMLTACGNSTSSTSLSSTSTLEDIKIYSPDGAPALSLSKVVEEENIDLEIVSDPTILPSKFSPNGDANFAVVPSNMASLIYSKFGAQFLSTVTYGNLYMVGMNEDVEIDYNDLIGKVVSNIGQGQVPDQIFKGILTKLEIPYEASTTPIEGKVALTYMTSAAEMAGVLSTNKADYVIGGEPSVSPLLGALDNSYIVSDIQKEYGEAFDCESGFPQAVLIAKKGYVESNPDEVIQVTNLVKEANEFLESDLETAKTNLINNGSNALKNINQEIVSRCNIVYKTKDTQRDAIETLFSIFAPASYGSELPDDNFYPNIPQSN